MADPSPTLLDANAAMLRAVASHNENTHLVPMPRGEIDRIRMPCTRGDDEATVELPPSLKALLAFDSKLCIRGRLFFEQLHGTRLLSTTMTEVFRASAAAKVYADLTTTAEADMPALIELPIASDQRVFLYVATPDADGEYPILRWDDEPCIWVSAGRLQDEIAAWDDPNVSGALERKQAANEAVAKWLEREPEQRFYESDDDDEDDADDDDDE